MIFTKSQIGPIFLVSNAYGMSMATAVAHENIPGLEQKLSRAEARHLVENDPAAAIFILMELSAKLAALQQQDASAPSSATPVYKKPTTAAGRKKKTKRGAKQGHEGKRRGVPIQIDRTEIHDAPKICPNCNGKNLTQLEGKNATRKRIIEDIPEDTRAEATEHIIPRSYCKDCKKIVEAVVADALPGFTFGHRMIVFVAWMRFGLGITLSQIQQVLSAHLQFPISQGAIVKGAHRVAGILRPWYEHIGEAVKSSGVLNADETGWRVLGKTWWLWCFCSERETYYMINRSRGSPALSEFFTEAIQGILITDFWGPYNAVDCGARQVCLPHLFREMDATTKIDSSEAWVAFRKKLARLLGDGLRLFKAKNMSAETRSSRRQRLGDRLAAMLVAVDTSTDSEDNANVKRIIKRLRRHQNDLFTFLDYEGVAPSNNFAEREIRPAVILRKNTFGNQSTGGAETQSILMSIFRTLRRRNLDPMAEIVKALRVYVQTGQLPPLPE